MTTSATWNCPICKASLPIQSADTKYEALWATQLHFRYHHIFGRLRLRLLILTRRVKWHQT